MGDLFWNKVAGVIIGGVLVVLIITELGHLLVPAHSVEELTADNTAYPVDWAAVGGDSTGAVEVVEAGPVDYGLLLAGADIASGERITRRCQSCHTFDEGGATGTGPNLFDVVGRDIASIAGFGYSNALVDLEGGWSFEALDGFMESPRNYANGTAMSFAGLRNEDDRMDLIAYLRSLSNSPIALPAALSAMETAVVEEADTATELVEEPAGDVVETNADETSDDPMPETAGEDVPADDGDH
jgi:cytochrome c